MRTPCTVLVALENRLVRGADARIYSSSGVDGPAFWRRYRETFDEVLVAARTENGDTTGLVPIEGDGVRVIPLPAYQGPWGYALARRRLRAALRAGIGAADALCLRAPGAIARTAWSLRGDRPVGVEVIGDPHDALAPGVVRSTLRPLARASLVRDLRAMCGGAAASGYVAAILRRRYPPGAWSTVCSDVDLGDEAFAAQTALAARAARLRAPRDVTDPWRLVFVGSLAQLYKAPDVLIDAVARVRDAVPLILTIVGDGRHRAALEADVAARGLGDTVRFTGALPAGAGVRAELDRADVFVLPSRTEGLPRALVEAMARGLPCVGASVGGIPELLPEDRLVPPGDDAALAATLTRLFRHKDALVTASTRDHTTALQYHAERLRPRRRAFLERLRQEAEPASRERQVREAPPVGPAITAAAYASDTAPGAEASVADVATAAAEAPVVDVPSGAAPSVQRNAAWALAGNLGYAACQWAILIAIAKLGSAADVGRFALGLALTAPAMMLANLHLRAIQATDARGEYPFRVYLRLRLLTTFTALAGITLVTLALGYHGADLGVVLAVAAAKAVESLSDVTFGLLQQAERLRRIACSMLLKGVLSVGATASVLALGGDLVTASIVLAGAWAVVLLANDLQAARRLAPLRGHVSRQTLAALARLALPMGCVMALNSLTANVPRYALAASLGPVGLGHFAALVSLLVAATQPLLAVGAAASPRLARLFVEDGAAYRRLTGQVLALAATLGAGAILGAFVGGHALLTLAYAPEYAAHTPVLLLLAVTAAVGFLASGFGLAVTAARRFMPQLAIAAVALAACAVASQVLVPLLGLRGAALAMLAGETTRLLALGTVYALLCAPKTRRAADRAAAVAPLRVLHVFGSMERGGAETRTLEMMRRLDRRRYVFDFCVLSGVPGSYAAEIARLGGRVAPCPLRPGRVSFTPRFVRLVRAGRYDVVHSHVHHFSGVVLLLARFAGVRTRIAHLRTAHEQQGSGPLRGAYRSLGRRLLTWHATSVIGVSAAALESFFGEHWERDQRRRLIYNGIEGTRFAGHRDRARVRAELGIRSHAPVIAHVGNFTPAKNHDGLVRIAAAVVARRPDAVFLLVGSGERRSVIEDQVARGGLQRAFRFVGARDDVPRLLAAADAFAFPSLWEGLPGAVLEALASGLPVVASPIPGVLEIARHTSELSTFDRAADAPRARIVAVDPTDASAFAATLVELCTAEARPPAGVATLPRPFTIEESMERLLQCYR